MPKKKRASSGAKKPAAKKSVGPAFRPQCVRSSSGSALAQPSAARRLMHVASALGPQPSVREFEDAFSHADFAQKAAAASDEPWTTPGHPGARTIKPSWRKTAC